MLQKHTLKINCCWFLTVGKLWTAILALHVSYIESVNAYVLGIYIGWMSPHLAIGCGKAYPLCSVCSTIKSWLYMTHRHVYRYVRLPLTLYASNPCLQNAIHEMTKKIILSIVPVSIMVVCHITFTAMFARSAFKLNHWSPCRQLGVQLFIRSFTCRTIPIEALICFAETWH